MATRESTQAAPAAIVSESAETAISVRKFLLAALSILAEIEEEQTRVFSVAAAGESVASSDAHNERNLFRVIQTLTDSTTLTNLLRDRLEEIGTSIGVSCEVQS